MTIQSILVLRSDCVGGGANIIHDISQPSAFELQQGNAFSWQQLQESTPLICDFVLIPEIPTFEAAPSTTAPDVLASPTNSKTSFRERRQAALNEQIMTKIDSLQLNPCGVDNVLLFTDLSDTASDFLASLSNCRFQTAALLPVEAMPSTFSFSFTPENQNDQFLYMGTSDQYPPESSAFAEVIVQFDVSEAERLFQEQPQSHKQERPTQHEGEMAANDTVVEMEREIHDQLQTEVLPWMQPSNSTPGSSIVPFLHTSFKTAGVKEQIHNTTIRRMSFTKSDNLTQSTERSKRARFLNSSVDLQECNIFGQALATLDEIMQDQNELGRPRCLAPRFVSIFDDGGVYSKSRQRKLQHSVALAPSASIATINSTGQPLSNRTASTSAAQQIPPICHAVPTPAVIQPKQPLMPQVAPILEETMRLREEMLLLRSETQHNKPRMHVKNATVTKSSAMEEKDPIIIPPRPKLPRVPPVAIVSPHNPRSDNEILLLQELQAMAQREERVINHILTGMAIVWVVLVVAFVWLFFRVRKKLYLQQVMEEIEQLLSKKNATTPKENNDQIEPVGPVEMPVSVPGIDPTRKTPETDKQTLNSDAEKRTCCSSSPARAPTGTAVRLRSSPSLTHRSRNKASALLSSGLTTASTRSMHSQFEPVNQEAEQILSAGSSAFNAALRAKTEEERLSLPANGTTKVSNHTRALPKSPPDTRSVAISCGLTSGSSFIQQLQAARLQKADSKSPPCANLQATNSEAASQFRDLSDLAKAWKERNATVAMPGKSAPESTKEESIVVPGSGAANQATPPEAKSEIELSPCSKLAKQWEEAKSSRRSKKKGSMSQRLAPELPDLAIKATVPVKAKPIVAPCPDPTMMFSNYSSMPQTGLKETKKTNTKKAKSLYISPFISKLDTPEKPEDNSLAPSPAPTTGSDGSFLDDYW